MEKRCCFWRMWNAIFGRYFWMLITPWFAIHLRSGADDEEWFWLDQNWRGLRIYHHHAKGWMYRDGDIMFYECESLAFDYYLKQTLY